MSAVVQQQQVGESLIILTYRFASSGLGVTGISPNLTSMQVTAPSTGPVEEYRFSLRLIKVSRMDAGMVKVVDVNYSTPTFTPPPTPYLNPVSVAFKQPYAASIDVDLNAPQLMSIQWPGLKPIKPRPIDIAPSITLDVDDALPVVVSLRSQRLNAVEARFSMLSNVTIRNVDELTPIIKQAINTIHEEDPGESMEGIDLEKVEELYSTEVKPILGLGEVKPEKPVIILAHRSREGYIEFLKRFLREVYRVRVGGLPEPR
ncbi:hypothetical protein, partial [Caldivirga sp.]|uniref:hypothetical protein n=1 Tax=Caldivirga sp. TaxID=2080243 RepID=UPI003D11D2ED